MSPFTESMTDYIENSKESVKQLWKLLSKFRKVTG